MYRASSSFEFIKGKYFGFLLCLLNRHHWLRLHLWRNNLRNINWNLIHAIFATIFLRWFTTVFSQILSIMLFNYCWGMRRKLNFLQFYLFFINLVSDFFNVVYLLFVNRLELEFNVKLANWSSQLFHIIMAMVWIITTFVVIMIMMSKLIVVTRITRRTFLWIKITITTRMRNINLWECLNVNWDNTLSFLGKFSIHFDSN